MRKPQSAEFHFEEFDFIKLAWPQFSARFNDDAACFNRYIDMQANAAREDGFAWLADSMLAYKQAERISL